MSYCRFAWDNSDVYVYEGSYGFECCGCKMLPSFTCDTELEMIEHLIKHLEIGHTVPQYAFTGLLDEYYSKVEKKPLPAFQVKLQKMYLKVLKPKEEKCQRKKGKGRGSARGVEKKI